MAKFGSSEPSAVYIPPLQPPLPCTIQLGTKINHNKLCTISTEQKELNPADPTMRTQKGDAMSTMSSRSSLPSSMKSSLRSLTTLSRRILKATKQKAGKVLSPKSKKRQKGKSHAPPTEDDGSSLASSHCSIPDSKSDVVAVTGSDLAVERRGTVVMEKDHKELSQ
jgi:hypothetical protein